MEEGDDRGRQATELELADLLRLVGLPEPTLARGEVTALLGAHPERALRWWRAMGLPEAAEGDVVFGEADLELVQRLHALVDSGTVSDDDVVRLARVLGGSFSRLVEAQLELVHQALDTGNDDDSHEATVIRLLEQREESDLDVIGALESTMLYVWRRHLHFALGRWVTPDSSATDQAVGFADLSGFTSFSRTLDADQLAALVDDFEAVAFDVVSSHAGRVVKFIGDEVMYVAANTERAVDIAIALIDRLHTIDEMPDVHCGVASGRVVSLGGDVFGPVVNLASRLAELARPGTVLVPRESVEQLGLREDLVVRNVRRAVEVRGVGRVRVTSIRSG